ncbi:Uncharacterised protein [Mycobacteroides abscessus subsp. massiliense]|jgi:hypothetical protein|nr:Uncharacterised protein [Mycobacteroides abscessus subsp. bolletii]SKV38794.1 Uncharacterised protein [Mycobacteroides abscessus subsp. massiliense]
MIAIAVVRATAIFQPAKRAVVDSKTLMQQDVLEWAGGIVCRLAEGG